MNSMPLLSLLFLTLPAGAALSWLLPRPEWAKRIALAAALVDLCIAIAVVVRFDPSESGFQLVEQANWIPTLNIQYLVGVDGISVLFLPATVLLFIGVILASWNSVTILPRLYYSLLLLLETTTLGIFCSLDTMLFFLFWELSLVPLYFLVSLWGIGPNRRYAAVKYILVMLAGGIPLLFGFVLLAYNHAALSGSLAFDLPTLLATPMGAKLEITVFLLLLLGFAVKTPLFPLHTWLPLMAMEGPAAVTALLLGIKLGAYGLIRFVIPLAPHAAHQMHWLLVGLGTIAVLYGAVAALAQSNLRRMLAYASL
ncbi:MAG: NADH-quinone oxidoreductase subunit M, partial [Sulfurimicrobium sp.]|nr:NADH-quinone oxidoreductase subunit M [Sulfurimicrobium sp.]